jgi:CDP-glucose 4,6-dehydratase
VQHHDFKRAFWNGRRVLVTGHTGFKGTWLCALLLRLGARVSAFALEPLPGPNAWVDGGYERHVDAQILDIRDADLVAKAVAKLAPETVFHLAAQPLVKYGYREPIETYATNVMGTVHVLDAVRRTPSVREAVIVTSDKVYRDAPVPGGYREDAPLGGYDPYAGSKACAELVVETYRSAYFQGPNVANVASGRAGNVIGGGDYAVDRLVPDFVRAIGNGVPLVLRHPEAIRPWQHVLDPLSGYVRLAEELHGDEAFASAWNFGPAATGVSVGELVEIFADAWGPDARRGFRVEASDLHETASLEIDSARAHEQLGWHPRWNVGASIARTAEWYRDRAAGADAAELIDRDLAAFEARDDATVIAS